MTIPKACCNPYTYSPPMQKPVGNVIHTWYLPNDDETHLIRHDDKIEYQTLRGKEKISNFVSLTDLPEIFSSSEEFIEFMMTMDPIVDPDGNLEFISTEKLHTWNVKYRDPIDLVYATNELYFKTTSDKETVLGKFSVSNGSSLEEQVNGVKERYIHVYGSKNKSKFEFEEKVQERKSAIDENISIDMDHWCVTMLNADSSDVLDDLYSPCNWMGHALLIIETIEEGNYFSRQADLANVNGEAKVRFFELAPLTAKRYAKDYAKSETHRKPKEDIQKMIDAIWLNVCDQNIIFKIDGDERPFWERFHTINDPTAFKKNTNVANCIKYSIEKMEVANIKPNLSSGCVLSNEVFKTPVLYAGSKTKAIAQEALSIALQTGLYSGTTAVAAAAFAKLSLFSTTHAAVGSLAACIVAGPIAGASVVAGSFFGALYSMQLPAYLVQGQILAASIGAVGGCVASLTRVAGKYAKKEDHQKDLNTESVNEKTIKPSTIEENK